MKLPLIIAVLIVYILLGSAAFLFFEHAHHEQQIRKWYFNHAINRRQFARAISRRIFNDTKNRLIIIDREQTERVQAHLVDALKQYEMQLDIVAPDRREWHLLNSLNFALALLTTIGHGNQLPETTAGQVFSLLYSVIGVPFFFGTITVLIYQLILPLFQTRFYNHLATTPTLIVLLSVSVTISLGILVVFLAASLTEQRGPSTGKVDDRKAEIPKFEVVVDEGGSSKLAT
uniref:Potassium channel domain-containing protein n=1 Tax=Parascaris univalens TaxID=6257 RepID=A0A915BWL1_PARUN